MLFRSDLMPANRINRHAEFGQLASASGGEYAPGRPDGRSLFSLPGQMGSPAPVAASVGVAPNAASRPGRPTDGYSFYAPSGSKTGNAPQPRPGTGRNIRSGRSAFSGGPDIPEPVPADPYAFPRGGRGAQAPGWLGAGPYGDNPNW